jgi:hypothetical protein
MHRLGDDYLMINYVVDFEPDRRIFWEPAPGDPSRAEGDDPSKVGIPAGYRWGYILIPDGDHATVVTEVFDCGPLPEDLLRDGGAWINGNSSVHESMAASLEMLEKISTE